MPVQKAPFKVGKRIKTTESPSPRRIRHLIQPKTASLNANLNSDKITTHLTNPVSIELLQETFNSSNVIKEERRED